MNINLNPNHYTDCFVLLKAHAPTKRADVVARKKKKKEKKKKRKQWCGADKVNVNANPSHCTHRFVRIKDGFGISEHKPIYNINTNKNSKIKPTGK